MPNGFAHPVPHRPTRSAPPQPHSLPLTDGIAILNSNDLEGGFRRVTDDLSSYYLRSQIAQRRLSTAKHRRVLRRRGERRRSIRRETGSWRFEGRVECRKAARIDWIERHVGAICPGQHRLELDCMGDLCEIHAIGIT